MKEKDLLEINFFSSHRRKKQNVIFGCDYKSFDYFLVIIKKRENFLTLKNEAEKRAKFEVSLQHTPKTEDIFPLPLHFISLVLIIFPLKRHAKISQEAIKKNSVQILSNLFERAKRKNRHRKQSVSLSA